MIIREATAEDISAIKRISDSLQVSRKQKDWSKKTTGFFEYTKTKREFLESLNPYFLVAEDNGRVVGYYLSYDSDFLRKRYSNTKSKGMKFLLENVKGDFLYSDQLGVSDDYRNKGIASSLFDEARRLASRNNLQRMIGFISEKPFFNRDSIEFTKRKGWKKVNEIEVENGIILGVYELKLR